MFKLLNLKKIALEYFGATHAWLLSRSKEVKTEVDALRMQKGLQRLANELQAASNDYGKIAKSIRQAQITKLEEDMKSSVPKPHDPFKL